jgi:hypothetical protein
MDHGVGFSVSTRRFRLYVKPSNKEFCSQCPRARPGDGTRDPGTYKSQYARRMVELLVEGLRYGTSTRIDKSLKPDARRNLKAPAK